MSNLANHTTSFPGSSLPLREQPGNEVGNHIALFCSRDNTGYRVKYRFTSMRCRFKSSNSDWSRFLVLTFLSNPRHHLRLDSEFKSSLVLIPVVRFEILLEIFQAHDF
jgi:hypothetical protein